MRMQRGQPAGCPESRWNRSRRVLPWSGVGRIAARRPILPAPLFAGAAPPNGGELVGAPTRTGRAGFRHLACCLEPRGTTDQAIRLRFREPRGVHLGLWEEILPARWRQSARLVGVLCDVESNTSDAADIPPPLPC